MRFGCLRQHALRILFVAFLAQRSAHAQRQWPSCLPSEAAASSADQSKQGLAFLEIPAGATGCSLALLQGNAAATSAVKLSSNAVIAGVHNGSFRRPPAVQLTSTADAGAAADAAPVLVVPQGGSLLLQGLLLVNASLPNPREAPSAALQPSGLSLGPGRTLLLRDVLLLVDTQSLQQYVAYMGALASAVFVTDGTSFLHIRSYSSKAAAAANSSSSSGAAAAFEAHSVTLIAPAGSTIGGTPLAVLQSLAAAVDSRGSSSSTGPVDNADLAAARGDAAGIVLATDSYVLGATNATLLRQLQDLNSPQIPAQRPLLICLASNVTLAPRAWEKAWPAAGISIRRQLLLVGSSVRRPSIDLGMQVRQMVLEGPASNVTLFNVALENLAYGDEGSGKNAEGASIVMPSQLWAFDFRRAWPKLVLWDCSLVLPEQRFIDSLVFWASAFNSELGFWNAQTVHMRTQLRVTLLQIVAGSEPGEYVIATLFKKDMRLVNTSLTTRPVAAPLLPLAFNASIHQVLVAGQADPAVGPVYSIEDLAVTLFNIARGGCGRSFVLLPSSPTTGVVSWGTPTELNYSRVTGGSPPNIELPTAANNNTSSKEYDGKTRTTAQSGDTPLPLFWPVDGGWLVRCPVQFQGTRVLDVGFLRGMFRLQDPLSAPQPGAAGPDSLSVAGGENAGLGLGSGPRALLQFVQMGFRGLPQGDLAAAAGSMHAATAVAVPTGDAAAGSLGGSSWVSKLPAEAYTHLLWFISRNVAASDQVSLSNVSLVIPPMEAAALAAAAAAALVAAAGKGEAAVLSMEMQQLQLHDVIGSGSFGVVYRATWRGVPAAVKVLQLPAAAGGSLGVGVGSGEGRAAGRREQMAVTETALGTSIHHPNIVQVYSYMLRPLGHFMADQGSGDSSGAGHGGERASGGGSSSQRASVTGYELHLVMEYCPMGSLRAALESRLLADPGSGRPHYASVLGLALGVARAMHHLHSEGVLHGDLKADNVLLKLELSGSSPAGTAARTWRPAGSSSSSSSAALGGPGGMAPCDQLVAKVADLGLACVLEEQDTHISGVHRGTLSHMSPELLLHGRASRASDVYAMGCLLYHMATGRRVFADVPKALLGAAVVRDGLRPAWPSNSNSSSSSSSEAAAAGTSSASAAQQQQQLFGNMAAELAPPLEYRRLAEACWQHEPQDRPSFAEVTATLEQLLAQEQQRQAAAAAQARQQQQLVSPAGRSAAGRRTSSSSTFHTLAEIAEEEVVPASPAAAAAAAAPRRVLGITAPARRAAAVAAVAAVLGVDPTPPKPPAAAAAAAAATGLGSRGDGDGSAAAAALTPAGPAADAADVPPGGERDAGDAAAGRTAAAAVGGVLGTQRGGRAGSPFQQLKDEPWED
ncbi:hypothetical protein OEZ86_007040 [Tetradesmus obliquus]|nr:hypothetical protein OEZ86_007040 [Tetradesmus obliquus]